MSQVLAEAEFLQTDVTYNQSAQYPYLFNAAVFNEVTMEWMVVARVWLDNKVNKDTNLHLRKYLILVGKVTQTLNWAIHFKL